MNAMKKPCAECPFRRDPDPAVFGMVDPLQLIGQAYGPFVLPCHSDPAYAGKDTDLTRNAQCAGAAIFRANVGRNLPPAIQRLEADRVTVCESPSELLASLSAGALDQGQAREFLSVHTPAKLLLVELKRAEVRPVPLTRPERS